MTVLGDLIYAADYNRIQQGVNNILGTGGQHPITNSPDITFGYGQSVSSTQLVQSGGFYPEISATHWLNLKSDILKIAYHQGLSVAVPLMEDLVGAAFVARTVDAILFVDNMAESSNVIRAGQTLSGLDVKPGTTILAQLNGATGGIGQYQISIPHTLTSRTFKVGASFTLADEIKAAHVTIFDTALSYVATNHLDLGVGQYADELLLNSSRTERWNKAVRHFFTLDFGNAAAAKYFFNAGGQIRMFSSRTGSPISVTKDNNWSDLLSDVGTVIFNWTSTISSNTNDTLKGIGQASTIGYYDLTTVDQQVYTHSGSSIAYQGNDYTITMSCELPPGVTSNSQGQASKIFVRIYFRDDTVRVYDDFVTGTLTSTISMYRATGSNVQVSGPTAVTTTGLTSNADEGGGKSFVVTYPGIARQGTPFPWSVSGGAANDTWYATTSAPNTPRIPASGTSSLDGNGAASYSGDFGVDSGLITTTFHFAQSGTVIKTITVLSGFSLTYPTTARQGTPFAWSVSGGNPYESWYATTTAPNRTRIPASGTFTLDSTGSATYTNGDFGTDTGVINVTFYFIQSGTVNRTINVLPAFQLTYPTTANELIPFSWSVANGQPYEAWYATTTAPHNLRIPATGYLYLESDGSKSYTNGDFGVDTGNINLTFYFSQSGTYNKTINVIPEPPQTIIIFPKTVNVNQVVSWTIESASTGAYIDISATGPAPFTNPQARVNQLTGYQSYPTIGPINYGPETPIYFYSHLNPRVTFTATGYYTVTFVTHSGYEGPASSTPYVTHVRHVRVI